MHYPLILTGLFTIFGFTQNQDCNVIQALTKVRHSYTLYYKTFDFQNNKSPFNGKIAYENLNFNLNSAGEPKK